MRCIEIAMQTTGKMAQQTININMRCIEMQYLLEHSAHTT